LNPPFSGKILAFLAGQAPPPPEIAHSLSIPAVRLVRPSRVMTDNHRHRRVTHLVGHVKRIQTLGKKQCGISVPALVERALAQPCEAKQPEPRPSDEQKSVEVSEFLLGTFGLKIRLTDFALRLSLFPQIRSRNFVARHQLMVCE
jgi:hypothetical protein